jgi:DNA repair exonuclease SbcCD ATPase subunit
VDKSTAETLQNQIEKLQKEGISQDKFKELQKNIESIQSMQQVDDGVIQDLVAQIKSAESATAKIDQTKQELSQQLDKTTQGALDRVEQMKQDLAKLAQLQTNMQSAVVDVLPQQIERLQSKVGELDSENEDQYNELLKHQQVLDKIAPGREGGTPQGQPGAPPPPTKPLGKPPVSGTPVGNNIARQQEKIDARRLAQAQGINVIDFEKEPEPMVESAFRRSIAWATGKPIKENK